jgi:hypothetical protein
MRLGHVSWPRLIAVAVAAVSLSGCGHSLLPSSSQADRIGFTTYAEVRTAYDRIQPGRTGTADLAQMGFDTEKASSVEVLSYLGVIERFMPRESIDMDDLDPSVRACLQSRVECSAYIFRPTRIVNQRTGNVPLDLLGFKRTTEQTGWSAEIMFLIHNDRVIYKVWAGKPHIDGVKQVIQPLGPFQDLSGVAGGAVANVVVPGD